MENIIERVILQHHSKSNYSRKALQLFYVSFLFNLLLIFFTIKQISLFEINFNLKELLGIHAMIGLLVGLTGLWLSHLSKKTKEHRGFQNAVTVWGFTILVVALMAMYLSI